MSARPRNAVLAEARAEVRALAAQLKEHRRGCERCGARLPCPEADPLAADLAAARETVRHWFDPGPGDVRLW